MPTTEAIHRPPQRTLRPLLTRRHLVVALGGLWLLDGALQFQPYMFSPGFFAGILGMANMGLPGPVSNADFHVASLLAAHQAAWNSLFAAFQVALGAGMLWPRTARAALALSVPWALGVWVIGEGFGASFMGGTSLLTGAPGAALVYAVAAVVLWPGRGAWRDRFPERDRFRPGFAVAAWAAIWGLSALLEFGSTNHAAGVPAAQITDTAAGQPWVMRALNQGLARLLEGHGAAFALVLGVCAMTIGVGVLGTGTRSAALVSGMIVAVFVGFVGQDLGGLFSGQATDPGSGPPLIILALTLWVATRPIRQSRSDRLTRSDRRGRSERQLLDLRLDSLEGGPHVISVGSTAGPTE